MSSDREISGHSGRKLSAKAEDYAALIKKHGYDGLDTPGRRGRPRGPASLRAKQIGLSSRTGRRHVAIARGLLERFNILPAQLAGTSLETWAEMKALLSLPYREAVILAVAAGKGKRVSAKRRLQSQRPAEYRVIDEINAMVKLYTKSSPEARKRFASMLIESLNGHT